jgi:hypothetical protein
MQARSIALKAACLVALVMVGCAKEDPGGAAGTGTSGGAGGTTGGAGGTTGGAGGETGGSGGSASGGAGGMDMAGMGGEAGMTVTGGMGGAGGAGGAGGDTTIDTTVPDIRGTGSCAGLDTGYMGDDQCLPAPAEGEGFQIHVGPPSYDPAPAEWLVVPSQEDSMCVDFVTPNTEEVYYQTFVLAGRPGTHHIINTMYVSTTQVAPGQYRACMDGGTGTNGSIVDNLPGASKAYMPRSKVAPENMHIGRKAPAMAPSQADMHYFNFMESGDLLREFWMNIYIVSADQITEESQQIRAMGGLKWLAAPIPMQPTEQLFKYEVMIEGDGRILSLLGHYHSHGKRFTTHIRRAGGEREKVFEMYDYNDPAEFGYNSIANNPEFSDKSAGAIDGMLEIKAGDVLEWECSILNDDQPGGLYYTNEVKTGEMCNLWGASTGPKINYVEPLF